jgi:hypothetical protein
LTSIGLDSLLAIDVGARLKRELDLDISILKLLRGVTLDHLLADIQERITLATDRTDVSPTR